jgi:hypothetical protein
MLFNILRNELASFYSPIFGFYVNFSLGKGADN